MGRTSVPVREVAKIAKLSARPSTRHHSEKLEDILGLAMVRAFLEISTT